MRSVGKFIHYLCQPIRLKTRPACLLAHTRQSHHKSCSKQVKKVKNPSECLEPCKGPGKKSLWGIFGGSNKPPQEKKPVREYEHVEIVSEEQAEMDMKKIAEMGGEVYSTCGTAYILQQDHYQQPKPYRPSNEDIILEEMMKDPSLKGQCDPMPAYETVALRMINLNDRRLHPLYKKLMTIPRKPKPVISSKPKTDTKLSNPASSYQTRSGPVKPEDYPAHLKINKEMLQKKNIMCEFKRAEPPQQMLGRMVEIKQNERPTLMEPPKNIVEVLRNN
ncbi:unnamed protein product [Ceutorhynchus assimilis]|uniref:Uncharacterized protein n=1 Tax=Ceutorhynchus assimilis TaxID=467358 RepID=A0A9N9MXL2_9CUCU|nr:unnamed protein product [Ceutorhynchus assimilis]